MSISRAANQALLSLPRIAGLSFRHHRFPRSLADLDSLDGAGCMPFPPQTLRTLLRRFILSRQPDVATVRVLTLPTIAGDPHRPTRYGTGTRSPLRYSGC